MTPFITNPYRFAGTGADHEYITDLSTNDGWAGTGTYSYVTNYLQLSSNAGAIVIDLEDADVFGTGNLLSDTTHYTEYQFRVVSVGGADNEHMMGFSTVNQTGGRTTSQAWFGMASLIGYAPSPAQNGMYVESTASGNVPVAGGGTKAAYQMVSSTTYMIKLRRLTSTTASVEIWNSAGTTQHATSGTHTILSTEGNSLKYIKFLTYNSASSSYSYQIHDITVRSGVSE